MSDYFNAFWSLYPRKVAKVVAQKAASKIKQDEWPIVMEGLKKYIKVWTDKQFIPHPATFLNQRRFEDEIETIEEVKTESAAQIFIKSVQNQSNRSMPDFTPDIKMAFFRMGIPWGQIQKLSIEEVTEKFERAYKNEPEKKIVDRMCLAANDTVEV